MKEIQIPFTATIFDILHPSELMGLCVTTNGIVRSNGTAVMGKGIALEAENRFHVSALLGSYLRQYGNRAFNLGVYHVSNSFGQNIPFRLFSFPTKYDWKNDSDITLIAQSCEQMMELCDKFRIYHCVLPRPGCANGHLNYQVTVQPVISLLLDDRFTVISKKE